MFVQNLNAINTFIDVLWLEAGLARNTLAAYRGDLVLYARWLSEQQPALDLDSTEEHHLQAYFAARHEQIRATSANRRLATLRRYFRWALREQRISVDPTARLSDARKPPRVPRILSEAQVEALLQAPDVTTPLGLRDRAMLELMYASGLRVSELVTLKIFQMDLRQKMLHVLGKGGKERLVPFGQEASQWIERYLQQARPALCGHQTTYDLFVTKRGSGMTRTMFWIIVKKWAQVAGLTVALSPHTLRHAFATHLVNHGADLRVVQLLLGHDDIETTTIYVHVAREQLKSVIAQHHPREKAVAK